MRHAAALCAVGFAPSGALTLKHLAQLTAVSTESASLTAVSAKSASHACAVQPSARSLSRARPFRLVQHTRTRALFWAMCRPSSPTGGSNGSMAGIFCPWARLPTFWTRINEGTAQSLRMCALSMYPPTGVTASQASIDLQNRSQCSVCTARINSKNGQIVQKTN